MTTTVASTASEPTAPFTGDLTTTRAPFIEEARDRGSLFIRQPYELYSESNHEAWRRLYERMLPRWRKYAHHRFLEGVESLALDPERVPRIEDINRFLEPLSGFQCKPVSGYVPAYLFFDCLRRREFPTTITIRDKDTLDYLPEPDVFHDIGGHVPMHTHRRFSDVLVRFGEVAHAAARRAAGIEDLEQRTRVVESNIRALARFFWFTIEFGIMKGGDEGICVYGSGLLSSFGELEYAVSSPECQRSPFQLDWVIHQGFEIDRYQVLLFVVDSFLHLFDEIDRLERWLHEGRLDHVAPGQPEINEADLQSFLEARCD